MFRFFRENHRLVNLSTSPLKSKILSVGRIVAASLLVSAVSPTVDAQTGMDPERLALIPTRMQEFVEEGQIAGAVMVLVRHDRIVLLEAVGYLDLETQTPMRTDAIFWMASVAKPMTALGIMVLQEEGRLSTRDPVGRHLPDFRNLQVEGASEPGRPCGNLRVEAVGVLTWHDTPI